MILPIPNRREQEQNPDRQESIKSFIIDFYFKPGIFTFLHRKRIDIAPTIKTVGIKPFLFTGK